MGSGVVKTSLSVNESDSNGQESEECVEQSDTDTEVPSRGHSQIENLEEAIEQGFAAALLKLEHLVHVPSKAIDVFLEELHHFISVAPVPLSSDKVSDIFRQRNIPVDELVVRELVNAICSTSPVQVSIQKGGPLSTAYLRRQYYKDTFGIVEPVEYILDARRKRSFQYVPILKSLQQLLNRSEIVDQVVRGHQSQGSTDSGLYKSLRDGSLLKGNSFLTGDRPRIILSLYVDDFETCNPLGTSRKTHKLCAVYWVLSNLPPGCHSTLSSIYLAILCKSDDVRDYGLDKVFEPLLEDLKTLEDLGIYVPLLGESLTIYQGTIFSVVADNLGAHGVAGFTRSFSGEYYCRFCPGKRSDIQQQFVASGVFNLRTKELHQSHIREAQATGGFCCGVETDCIFTKNLSHFHVIFGYPPDLAHDLFEGIIPVEIARCLGVLISQKLFTLAHLNSVVREFPYKWSDKTNKPHVVSQHFRRNQSVGGNCHENWSLLRFLPFFVGSLVPEDEPAWLVLMVLKDIVELVVAPVHSDASLAFLESKITEHRQRYIELFPDKRLLPKHHFLEHYPQMIKLFGPLVGQWTMRFEAKHSFFKQVIRHTSCFKNVPLSLASKHQMMIGYHLASPSKSKPDIEVSAVSTLSVDLLREEIAHAIRANFSGEPEVHLAQCVTRKGITYRKGMILAHRTVGGLPEFSEIDQICVIRDSVFYIVKELCGWYTEHYRAFELTAAPTRSFTLVALSELLDDYPLADYEIGSARMVTLKRHIEIKGTCTSGVKICIQWCFMLFRQAMQLLAYATSNATSDQYLYSALALSVTASHKTVQMKVDIAVMRIDILIMLLDRSIVEILI